MLRNIKMMFEIAVILTFTSLVSSTFYVAGCPAFAEVATMSISPEHPSGRYLNQVYAWAAGREVTITPRGHRVWIEVAGADEFGVGKTAEDAAKSFMESVDLMTHELNVPQPKKGM